MDGDEPGTPDWWPENPWAHVAPKMPGFQPAPSSELVSNTVQNIFQKARDEAIGRIARREFQIRQLARSLPPARKPSTMTFRYTSGEAFQVCLNDNQNTINRIQHRSTDAQLRRSIIKAFIPGIPEPLSNDQDLRHLLPNVPELELRLSR